MKETELLAFLEGHRISLPEFHVLQMVHYACLLPDELARHAAAESRWFPDRLTPATTVACRNALAGLIYLSWLGKHGLVELAELMLRRSHYARETLGLEAINPGPVVREFAVRVPDLDAAFERARAAGINPGYRLGRDYPEYGDGLLVAIIERRTKADIDRLASVLGGVREGAPA